MNKLFSGVFKNRKVLVTGHTGFKGSWLTLWLLELGADVIGYALEPPSEPNIFNSLNLKDKIVDIRADVRDENKLNEVFKKYKPEIVFHMAAQSLVRRSYREPKLTFDTNVVGTINMFETVRETDSVKVVVNVTSDKCYENKEWVYGYRETDNLGGYDPYSFSKACSELVTSAYRESFFNHSQHGKKHGVSIASVRAGNVIGGGDWADDRLIPDCIRCLVSNRPINIRNPDAVRPWQFVLDPLSGYLLLASLMWKHGPKYGGAWNFGPYDEDIIPVKKIADSIIKFWGGGRLEINTTEQPHEAQLLKLDVSKARFKLNWKPAYNSEKAIEKTVDWYRKFYDKKTDMRKFSTLQIEEYVKKLNFY